MVFIQKQPEKTLISLVSHPFQAELFLAFPSVPRLNYIS